MRVCRVNDMDKYERVRVVGRGAFGTVYLCRRLRDHREVIVKQVTDDIENFVWCL